MELQGSYAAADLSDEAKQELMVDYLSFKNWLTAREMVLLAFYPGQTETAQEVLAAETMLRVMELCNQK